MGKTVLGVCRREQSSSQCQLSLPFSPESGEFVVERFGLCQGFLELSSGRSSCTEKRVDPLKEIVRSDAERVEICLKLFLAEIVGFVDRIKDLDKAVNSSCQATSHQVNFSTRGRLGGIVERESGAPKEVFDDGLLEMRGVMGNLCLETLDRLVRVVEGTANSNLCTIHEAVKAIGRLLPVIGAHEALIAVIDGRGDKVKVPVEQIDTLASYRIWSMSNGWFSS